MDTGESLAIIDRVIGQHLALSSGVLLAGQTVSDLEAIFSLQKAYSSWSQGSVEMLAEKLNGIKQTVNTLFQGLNNHFQFEETNLPPLFGDLIMCALVIDHREIRRRLDKAIAALAETRLEGLSREEILAAKSNIQKVINDVIQVITEHASREEIILRMVKRVLEEDLANQDIIPTS